MPVQERVDADVKTHERWHKNEWMPVQKRMDAEAKTRGSRIVRRDFRFAGRPW
jgi:hypothetical protein